MTREKKVVNKLRKVIKNKEGLYTVKLDDKGVLVIPKIAIRDLFLDETAKNIIAFELQSIKKEDSYLLNRISKKNRLTPIELVFNADETIEILKQDIEIVIINGSDSGIKEIWLKNPMPIPADIVKDIRKEEG